MATSRSWFSWSRLAGWSWPERLIVPAAWLVPLALAIRGDWGWLTGTLALSAFVLLQFVVWRHGGWRLLGPHFYYDVVRLARRGQSNRLRTAYLIALFAGLIFVFETSNTECVWRPNDFADVTERFSFVLFLVQNISVMVLTPAYLASAIAEEKERRTLELLFTTHLSSTEIILGVLFARTIHLAGFVLAGFPILCVIQFWGGIDMLMLAGNLANTLLNILTVGSFCIFISTQTKTVAAAVAVSYAIILPCCTGCAVRLQGAPFILQDARTGVTNAVTVQDLGVLFVGHAVVTVAFLALAVACLRESDPFAPGTIPPPRPRPRRANPKAVPATDGPGIRDQESGVRSQEPSAVVVAALVPADIPRRAIMVRAPHRLDILGAPYTLPAISGNALLWKECYLGGPAMALSPVLLSPMQPLFLTVIFVLAVWFLRGQSLNSDEYRRTVGMWSSLLKFFYYMFLTYYGLGVAFRAASSVARERQQQTLEPLLLLPVERREILGAKWFGCLWRGWPWLALALGDVAIGVVIRAYHPFSGVLLCLVPWPLLAFFTSLGLLLSVAVKTVLRANLVMLIVMIAFIITTVLPGYIDSFAFSWWSPRELPKLRMLLTAGILSVYLLGAWVCWRLALFLLENRSQQPE